MGKIICPDDYDYVGVYLTNKCHLKCPYCITEHYRAGYKNRYQQTLKPDEWVRNLNRFVLPKDVPVTLQGGEPFAYKGIWNILESLNHKIDIMTALPPFITKNDFVKLKTLEWNKRDTSYPTIRVSYHKGQNNYEDLIQRIAELQELVSIGLYYIDHPSNLEDEIFKLKVMASKYGVELRSKEFLGEWKGKKYGTFCYDEASSGIKQGINVCCKNTVVPIASDGKVYRCHSDLYFNRQSLALGNIIDVNLEIPQNHLPCENYGLCSECDVKVKTNHNQIFGYTSVNIKFDDMIKLKQHC